MIVYAPAQLISAPAQLITAPAQLPATGAVVYTALLKMYPFVHLSVRVSFAILKKLSPTHFVFSFLCIV